MAQLKELYNSMTASKELVRVLATVLPPAALNPTAASLLTALRSELDVARARARQIARDHRRFRGDESSEQQVREEMRAWKVRHREKAAAAARLVASELDAERRARQRAERVGKKLGDALADAESSLREARREVERERKARARLEKLCDELAAAGVGGAAPGEEEEEEMMRLREAEREDLEREREMLRVADELREERVRMKLAEARIQFEEKNAVVDQLRRELEAFLGRDGPEESSPAHDDHHRLQQQLVRASEPVVVHGIDRVAVHTKNREDGEVEDDDSDGSDIELNVDGNSRDYSWSYSTAASNKEMTTAAAARNAASSRHGSVSDGGAFDRRSQGLGELQWNEGRNSDDEDDGRASTAKEDMDEDAERYEAIKNLREQMLAGHGFVFLSSQQGEADADRHHHRHDAGFLCQQLQDGGQW